MPGYITLISFHEGTQWHERLAFYVTLDVSEKLKMLHQETVNTEDVPHNFAFKFSSPALFSNICGKGSC